MTGPRRVTATRLRVRPWDLTVDPLAAAEVVAWIADRRGTGGLVVGHNLHSAYLFLTDVAFREVYESADLAIVDGMPIAVLSRLSARGRNIPRVGSTDWIPLLDSSAVRRIAVIGGAPEISDKFSALLADHLQDVEVRGWNGYEDLQRLSTHAWAEVAAYSPELVILGLGMPLQEQLTPEIRQAIPDAILALVGGALDQLTGVQRRAPRVLQRLGLEWLWRLALAPRRLAHRYVVEPWKLLWITATGRKAR